MSHFLTYTMGELNHICLGDVSPPLSYGNNLPHFPTHNMFINGDILSFELMGYNTLFRWNKWGHKTNFR
jgi:hypothetical protein